MRPGVGKCESVSAVVRIHIELNGGTDGRGNGRTNKRTRKRASKRTNERLNERANEEWAKRRGNS